MDKTERRKFLESLPYVHRLNQSRQCTGKMINHRGRVEYTCLSPGYWKFTGLKRASFPARNGIYCFQHLHSKGLLYNQEEWNRTEKYWNIWKALKDDRTETNVN